MGKVEYRGIAAIDKGTWRKKRVRKGCAQKMCDERVRQQISAQVAMSRTRHRKGNGVKLRQKKVTGQGEARRQEADNWWNGHSR
jgi:hypothetical protein